MPKKPPAPNPPPPVDIEGETTWAERICWMFGIAVLVFLISHTVHVIFLGGKPW